MRVTIFFVTTSLLAAAATAEMQCGCDHLSDPPQDPICCDRFNGTYGTELPGNCDIGKWSQAKYDLYESCCQEADMRAWCADI